MMDLFIHLILVALTMHVVCGIVIGATLTAKIWFTYNKLPVASKLLKNMILWEALAFRKTLFD